MSSIMSSIMSSNNIFVYNDVIGNKQINLLKIQKSKKKIQKKIIYNRYLPLELINLIITFIPISNRIDVLLERFSLKNKMKIYFNIILKNKTNRRTKAERRPAAMAAVTT